MPSVQSVVTVKTSFARDTTWCKGQTGSRDRRQEMTPLKKDIVLFTGGDNGIFFDAINCK